MKIEECEWRRSRCESGEAACVRKSQEHEAEIKFERERKKFACFFICFKFSSLLIGKGSL